MTFSKSLFVSALVASSAAVAQAPAVLPGTIDSGKAANASHDDSASYNRVAGNFSQRGTKGAAVPANAADVRPGSSLRDIKGEPIATIDAVDAEGVIVSTGTTKVRLPLNAFGKDEMGLLLGITQAKFRLLVSKATAANSGG